MNKMICRVALVLAAASLVGCGLKGPLYFPPQEKPQAQSTDDAATSQQDTNRSPGLSTQTDQQSTTTEPELHSAQ